MDVDVGASSASQQLSRPGASKAKAQKAVVEQRRALVWARCGVRGRASGWGGGWAGAAGLAAGKWSPSEQQQEKQEL